MKYICLGYIEDKYFYGLSEKEQLDFMDACFAYDEELQKNGHFNIDSTFAGRPSRLKFRPHGRIT
jgi:hypothetical protein